jgi:hypothetical protein
MHPTTMLLDPVQQTVALTVNAGDNPPRLFLQYLPTANFLFFQYNCYALIMPLMLSHPTATDGIAQSITTNNSIGHKHR